MKIAAWYAALLGLAAFATGCGSSLTLVPVEGTVTVDGVPVEGAGVAYMPNVPNPDGETSYGVSGPDGRYQITTAGHLGVVPGKYRVTVSKKPPLDPSLIPEEFKDDPFMAEMSLSPERKGKSKSQDSAEAGSTRFEQVFSQEVPPEGKTIDLDVSTKPKPKPKEKIGRAARKP